MTSDFLSFISLAIVVTVLSIFWWNVVKRTRDALSMRNMFMLGYGYYFGLGAYFLGRGNTAGVSVNGSGMVLLGVMMAMFLILFLLAAQFGWRHHWLARIIPKVELPVTGPGLVIAIIALIFAALVGSLVNDLSYSAGIAAKARTQLATVAMGLATCYLVKRRFNPLSWSIFFMTLVLALLVGVVGHPGRRAPLGVMLAIPWMLYFVTWRYRSANTIVSRAAVVGVLAFLAVLIYTPIRYSGLGQSGTGATLESRANQLLELSQDPFKRVNARLLEDYVYSDTSPNSLFIVENYPERFSYTPGSALVFMLVNPIPRAYWPTKPQSLGIILQQQTHAAANLGPGIIGHGWYEGGIAGVAGYALFFGLLFGVTDAALWARSRNPYFVALIGSNLGNMIGMARGDTGLFLLEIITGIAVCAFVLWVINTCFGRIGGAFPVIPMGPPGEADEEESLETAGDELVPAYEPETA